MKLVIMYSLKKKIKLENAKCVSLILSGQKRIKLFCGSESDPVDLRPDPMLSITQGCRSGWSWPGSDLSEKTRIWPSRKIQIRIRHSKKTGSDLIIFFSVRKLIQLMCYCVKSWKRIWIQLTRIRMSRKDRIQPSKTPGSATLALMNEVND